MEKKTESPQSLPNLKNAKTPREKILAYMNCMNETQLKKLLSMAEMIFTR